MRCILGGISYSYESGLIDVIRHPPEIPGQCQGLEKCILCNGPHSATSKICPRHTLKQKILELKCRNHLTIGEARRLYAHSSKTNYSEAAKNNSTAPNIEEIVNQRVESIVQNITIKMEQQTTLLIEIFQKQ
ncbi:uncharacterized protein CEXT_458641 [Caerostris extrusa]|uniref:Uncharacterized protein n=1 Tax=Caerostris extrusa TaxID=172846 RepID=A0AAV4MXB3_CAEEX|nr:uncharacterized protein CEXT_458641 [Caerostris extrusa]